MSNINYIQTYIESISSSRTLLNQLVAIVRQQDSNLNNMLSTMLRNENTSNENRTHSNASNENASTSGPIIPNTSTDIFTNAPIDTIYNENTHPQSFRDRDERIRHSDHGAHFIAGNPPHPAEPTPNHSPQPRTPGQNIRMPPNYTYTPSYSIPRRTIASNNFRSYLFDWREHNIRRAQPDTNIENFLRPVNIHPSSQQINQATETLSFGEIINPTNTECPITREPFTIEERVIRIRRCGHIFNPYSLRRWFHVNVHCPMCRMDIRENLENQSPQNTPNGGTTIPSATQSNQTTPSNSRDTHSSNVNNRRLSAFQTRLNERRAQTQQNAQTQRYRSVANTDDNVSRVPTDEALYDDHDNANDSQQSSTFESRISNLTNSIARGINSHFNETDPSDNLLIQCEFMLPINFTDMLINEDINDQEILNQIHNNNFYNDNLSRNDFINMYNRANTNFMSTINNSNINNSNINNSTSIINTPANANANANADISSSAETND